MRTRLLFASAFGVGLHYSPVRRRANRLSAACQLDE
jgi:hypothetical protein